MSMFWTFLAIAIWVALGAAVTLAVIACVRCARENDGEVDE